MPQGGGPPGQRSVGCSRQSPLLLILLPPPHCLMGSWLSLVADAQAYVLGKVAQHNRLLQNGFCLPQVACNGSFIRISGSVQASPLNDSDEKCSGKRPTVVG